MRSRSAELVIKFDFQPLVREFERMGRALNETIMSLFPRRLVVDDPALRWAHTPSEFADQLSDILAHEFWCAAGQPERSPGARWEAVPGGLNYIWPSLQRSWPVRTGDEDR